MNDTETLLSDLLEAATISWLTTRTTLTLGPNHPKFQDSLWKSCVLFQGIIDHSTPFDWTDEELDFIEDAVNEIASWKDDENMAHLFAEDEEETDEL